MTKPLIHPERMNCRGCQLFQEADDGVMDCMDLIHFHGGTPPEAPCFEHNPAFLKAITTHRLLVESLGLEHPETQKAMMLVMELTPPWMLDQFGDMAKEMNLMPEASGYLEDGTPMFRLEDIAEKLGLSQEEAEAALQEMLADRAAQGLLVTGVTMDASLIHSKQ